VLLLEQEQQLQQQVLEQEVQKQQLQVLLLRLEQEQEQHELLLQMLLEHEQRQQQLLFEQERQRQLRPQEVPLSLSLVWSRDGVYSFENGAGLRRDWPCVTAGKSRSKRGHWKPQGGEIQSRLCDERLPACEAWQHFSWRHGRRRRHHCHRARATVPFGIVVPRLFSACFTVLYCTRASLLVVVVGWKEFECWLSASEGSNYRKARIVCDTVAL
jgi:hypothetical protein